MAEKLILYGASGHAKVVADIVRAARQAELAGCVDDDPSKSGRSIGTLPILGTSAVLPDLRSRQIAGAIVAIGRNDVRTAKAALLESMGFRLATAVHPRAVVAEDVVVGAGTVIMAGAVVNPGARIGRNVIVNTGATVDHDCVLEDGAHLSPGVHLAGHVIVEREAHIGIGASVIPGVRIGAASTVGANSAVIRDVPPGATVAGNPARDVSASS